MTTTTSSFPGYRDYQRREYCRDIKCSRQIELDAQPEGSKAHEKIRNRCKTQCLHTTYEFHHWLIGKGYLIVRPDRG